jgi:hypothetical protein
MRRADPGDCPEVGIQRHSAEQRMGSYQAPKKRFAVVEYSKQMPRQPAVPLRLLVVENPGMPQKPVTGARVMLQNRFGSGWQAAHPLDASEEALPPDGCLTHGLDPHCPLAGIKQTAMPPAPDHDRHGPAKKGKAAVPRAAEPPAHAQRTGLTAPADGRQAKSRLGKDLGRP